MGISGIVAVLLDLESTKSLANPLILEREVLVYQMWNSEGTFQPDEKIGKFFSSKIGKFDPRPT